MDIEKRKEANKTLSTIIPELDKNKPGMQNVGFMMSEARATAFAMLANAVKEFLTLSGCVEDTLEYDDAIETMADTYEALMEVVETESGNGKK